MITVASGIDIRDFLDSVGLPLFESYVREGQRIGQAFMNAAGPEIYNSLSGTLFDPFYKSDAISVVKAMEWLTRIS
jgi:hypothetical protein